MIKSSYTINSNIIIVSKYAIPFGYGISSKAYHTAKYFSDFDSVTLITSNSNHLSKFPDSSKMLNFIQIDKLNILWINTLLYKKSKSAMRLISWIDFEIKLRKLKIDKSNPPKVILVSSLSLITILWGLWLKKRHQTKVIFEIRDIYPLTLTSELSVSKYNPIVIAMTYIEKLGYLKSDRVVGTMPLLSRHVKKILGFERLTYYSPIGLSVYYDLNRRKGKEIIPQESFKIKPLVIGYSGSIGESNYLESFIRVIRSLQFNAKYFFVVVGSGDYLDKYKIELQDCNNVHFTGRVNPEVVQDYLISVDCLYFAVKPSQVWDYGQSLNKVLDYLMAGKPIIAAYNGFPNMINEVFGNLIIPSNDDEELLKALEKVQQYDKSILESIKANSPRLVLENYTYDVINKSYYSMVKELLE